MRRDNAFTLFEVLISMALSGMLVCSIGTMLVFGYRQLGRIIDINKNSSEIMIFRSHIENRIQKITGKGFLISDMVSNPDVRFIQWREYSPVPPILPNGLPNFNSATPLRVSNWTNLVGQKVIFNSVDPNNGDLIRCIYEYLPDMSEVEYREYEVPLNANGQEADLTVNNPTTTLRLKAVILKKITVFQVGRSSQGLPDWEVYGSRANSQSMTNPIMDAYIRVFVRTENDDVRYRTNKSFISRSTRREANFWTPSNKTMSFEFDPTLMEFFD
jgi:hypothetical protein